MEKKPWWRDPDSKESIILNFVAGCFFIAIALGGWAVFYAWASRYLLWSWEAVDEVFSLGFLFIFFGVLGGMSFYKGYSKLKKS